MVSSTYIFNLVPLGETREHLYFTLESLWEEKGNRNLGWGGD